MIPTRTHLHRLRQLILFGASSSFLLIWILSLVVVSQFDGTSIDAEPDCMLVFGAAVHSQTQPGPGIRRRVDRAANLYVNGATPMVILSGGKGDGVRDSEAAVMRREAMRLGIDPDHIVLEDQARNTWQNIENTAEISQNCTSLYGISDRYHLARIQFLAFRQGREFAGFLPASYHPYFWFEVRSVIREALGIVYYALNIA